MKQFLHDVLIQVESPVFQGFQDEDPEQNLLVETVAGVSTGLQLLAEGEDPCRGILEADQLNTDKLREEINREITFIPFY